MPSHEHAMMMINTMSVLQNIKFTVTVLYSLCLCLRPSIRWRSEIPPTHYPIPPSILPKAALSARPLIRFPFITIKSLNLIQFITIRSLKWNTVFLSAGTAKVTRREKRLHHLSWPLLLLPLMMVKSLCSQSHWNTMQRPINSHCSAQSDAT